jgi:hypothetical protein
MFRICKIIVDTTESANSLKKFLGGYPVEITTQIPEDDYHEVSTLMVGWNFVKSNFPNQKINNSDVLDNLSWTYNEVECKEMKDQTFHRNIEAFVNKNLYAWLPSEYILFDSLVHGDFGKYVENVFDNDVLTYIHFNNGALYMRNGDKNYIVNVKNMWLTEGDYRTAVTKILNQMNCIIYSHDGIEDYVDLDLLEDIRTLDIIRWIKFGVETPLKYFQIVPRVDISKYVPFLMSKIPLDDLSIDEDEEVFFKRMCLRDRITRWMSTRYVPFAYDFNRNLNFIYRENVKLAKINYSNKRTLTGRITSKDNYNPQNLSKSNEERTKIISKFRNGRIYQFDYTSFEARIALYLSEDEEFIQRFYDKDLHSETARIIFESQDFTPEQRDIAKLVNHSILYGASEATILKKLEGQEYPIEKMLRVKEFLSPLFAKSKELMLQAENDGYIINKWGSIIKPEKSYAGFNNYIQSTASEIVIDKVCEIKALLKGYQSDFLFQVHDSLVFDIHPEEVFLVEKIAKTLSFHRGMMFSIDYKSGINYKDLSSEGVYF